ncbi:MAG: endonuclease/exonuclease/phosphatase family protein [Tannerellaceae bacterium]|nr:endonuclease/exonuclease/phosphatase family protein [Tannerellaceae bacterium]
MVASAHSDLVSPERFVSAAYIGLLFPCFVTLNVLILLYRLLTFKWITAAISAVVFSLCWMPIQRYVPINSLPEETGNKTEENIKILTYNVMSFAWKPHTERSPNLILDYIITSDADIVCLQEYEVAVNGGGDQLADVTVRRVLKKYPYRSVVELRKMRKNAISGLAVYSKYPIIRSQRISYPSDYNGSSLHEIDIHGKKLLLINNHLESFKLTTTDRTQYSGVVTSFNTKYLEEIGTTFRHKLGSAFQTRARQGEAVASAIRENPADYVLVCGDFNDTPISYTYRTISKGLTDAFVASGNGVGITYHANFFWFRIDYILHSPNIRSSHCTVDKVNYSDHYPVWCFLQFDSRK